METISEPTETEIFRKVNQKLKRSKLTKIVSVICSILLVIFTGLNISWYFLKYRPYHVLCENMQKSDIGKGTQFRTEDSEFSYIVKMPAYLDFSGGFVSVSLKDSEIYLDENGHPVTKITPYVSTLFIWKQLHDETLYGIVIMKGNTMYQLMIDKSLKFIPYSDNQANEIETYEKMLAEHYDEINALMNAADRMWGDKLSDDTPKP